MFAALPGDAGRRSSWGAECCLGCCKVVTVTDSLLEPKQDRGDNGDEGLCLKDNTDDGDE